MKIALYIFVLYIHTCSCHTELPELTNKEDKKSAQTLFNIIEDIIKDTNRRIGLLRHEQKEASNCTAFEVGYLTYVLHEKYRRMVDKYNVSKYMMTRLYYSELILYLEEIEHHYWEINHISNMLHEVERKYHVEPDLDVEYEETTPEPVTTTLGEWQDYQEGKPDYLTLHTRHQKKRTRFKMDKYLQQQLTSTMASRTKKKGACTAIVWSFQPKENSIINDLSWGTKLKIFKQYNKDETPFRRVGISFLTAGDTDVKVDETTKSEDSSMKIKLFRLMYETVRDSDLKVRRAELIKSHYNNYTSFEIGYIMGDITDKMNIMTDISMTLKRLYAEWRPMEHINAYEQIANKAIEISHLIDMVRIIHKRGPATVEPSAAK